jgi:hypothetical protein
VALAADFLVALLAAGPRSPQEVGAAGDAALGDRPAVCPLYLRERPTWCIATEAPERPRGCCAAERGQEFSFREEPCLAEPSLSPPLTTSVGFPRTPPVASHAERGSRFGRNDMKGETSHASSFGWCCPSSFRRYTNPCGLLYRSGKRCRIVEERPAPGVGVIIGGVGFGVRTEAESRMRTECRETTSLGHRSAARARIARRECETGLHRGIPASAWVYGRAAGRHGPGWPRNRADRARACWRPNPSAYH